MTVPTDIAVPRWRRHAEGLNCVAHHEAGHLVIAAAQQLRLRPEGLRIDPQGEGRAYYCARRDASDLLRERVLIATLAGFKAEKRFCKEHFYPLPDERVYSYDWNEVWRIVMELSYCDLTGVCREMIVSRLENRTERLIEEHWSAIQGLAAALLGKDWEPLRPLKSEVEWSKQPKAKYVEGEEVIKILSQYGISAMCVSDC